MSGIYIPVWDEKTRDQSDLLKPTKGGWPHITVAYTFKLLNKQELSWIATLALKLAGKSIVLEKAYVNSFPIGDRMRHDVLLKVSDQELVDLRATLKEMYPDLYDDFSIQPLHVSHRVDYPTLEEAEADCKRLNASGLLPYPVTMIGVTID